MPEPSAFEFELPIENLNSHKLPGIDQIQAELNQARGWSIRYEIYKLLSLMWNKKELLEERKESVSLPIYKKGDERVCSNYSYMGI